jgi:membrane protein implicated in regulation of membrane protease activity
MLAANVWHWWIGIVLSLVVVLAVVALVASYLKSVSAQRHPSRRQQRQQHSDL